MFIVGCFCLFVRFGLFALVCFCCFDLWLDSFVVRLCLILVGCAHALRG